VSGEDESMYHTLEDALRYASEEDGLVPTAHIDYVYDLLEKHIKNEEGDMDNMKARKEHRRSRHKKLTQKRYIYARTQELFQKDLGQLARHVRQNDSWLGSNVVQLAVSDIETLSMKLWETNSVINKLFLGKMGRKKLNLTSHAYSLL
jgi:hypothetical protein